MEDLYYQLAKQITTLTKSLKVGDDYGANNACLLAKAILQKIPESRPYTKLQTNLIFVEVLNFMTLDLERYVAGQRKCMAYLRELFGDNIVLSDIYMIISTTRMKQNNVAEALEYAGRCLLTRVNKLGVMHEKTADSHYSLGALYRLLGDNENARKEISICRGIRSKLFCEFSLPVATCDLMLGHIEAQSNDSVSAYLAYYKCYHVRYLLLGEGNNLTVEAEDFTSRNKYFDGERLITSIELKNRVTELEWENEESHTLQYSVSMFVTRLSNDEVLIFPQLKALVSNAAQFALSRLNLLASDEGGVSGKDTPGARREKHPEDGSSSSGGSGSESEEYADEVDENPTAFRPGRNSGRGSSPVKKSSRSGSSNRSKNKNKKKQQQKQQKSSQKTAQQPSEFALLAASEGSPFFDIKEKIASIIEALLVPSRPSSFPPPDVLTSQSPGTTTAAAAPSSSPMKEMSMSSSLGSSAGFGSSSGSLKISSDAVGAAAATAVGHVRSPPAPRMAKHTAAPVAAVASEQSVVTPLTGDQHLTLTDPEHTGDVIDDLAAAASAAGSGPTGAVAVNSTGNPILNFRASSASAGSHHSSFAATVIPENPAGSMVHSSPETTSTIAGSKFSHRAVNLLSSADVPAVTTSNNERPASPDYDPFAYRPKNIKPVSPTLYKYRAVRSSSCRKTTDLTLPFALGGEPYLLGRDSLGVLVLIKRAGGQELLDCVRSKVFGVGLLQWLARNNLKERGLTAAATTGAAATGVPTPSLRASIITAADSKRASIKATARRISIMTSAGNNRSSVMSVRSMDESVGNRDPKASLLALFDKKKGPPLNADGSVRRVSVKGSAGAGPKWATNVPEPPPIPTCWPPVPWGVSADGANEDGGTGSGAISGCVNPNYDPTKPKLKQVYLVGLSAIDGTLWSERFAMPLSSEELFDDLEEEFMIGAPKAKPKLSQMPVGCLPSPVKKGANKKSAAESLLDAQRGQNINIMLAKFGKRSLFDIAKVIRDFDAEALGLSAIYSLLPFVPTSEEVTKINNYIKTSGVLKPRVSVDHLFQTVTEEAKKDITEGGKLPSVPEGKESAAAAPAPTGSEVVLVKSDAEILSQTKMGKAEQYVYVMSKVPALENRLSAMCIALTANETCHNISNQADIILNAVSQVKGSGRLKFILKSFLDLGNILSKNSKMSTGPMQGIKLSSLSELSRTKSNSGESAELYVVSKIYHRFPDALDVANDMPGIDEAKQVLYARLVSDLKKVEDGITLMRQLQESFTSGEGASGTSEECKANLTQHLENTQKLFNSASERLKESQSDYQELCTYFGEELVDPEVLFGQISTFLRGIQQSTNLIVAKEKRKAASAGRAAR